MRRVISLFVGYMLAASVSSAEPPQASPPQTAHGRPAQCKFIDDWILENRDNLPSTFDELARLPLAYRKRVFLELSPEQQSALWQTHLSRWLAGAWGSANGVLSDEQRALVAWIRGQLTADVYARQDTAWAPLEEIRTTFPDPELRSAVFSQLGPPQKSGETVFQFSSEPNCHCVVDWIGGDQCPYPLVCKPNDEGANCHEVRCGFWDLWTCDGMCCFPEGC